MTSETDSPDHAGSTARSGAADPFDAAFVACGWRLDDDPAVGGAWVKRTKGAAGRPVTLRATDVSPGAASAKPGRDSTRLQVTAHAASGAPLAAVIVRTSADGGFTSVSPHEPMAEEVAALAERLNAAIDEASPALEERRP